MNVQAYILNISAIQTIEELNERISRGYAHTVEISLTETEVDYTAPRWITQGDMVFFYHALSANKHNKRLRKEVEGGNFENKNALIKYLDDCDRIYEKYGGKIYAVGAVSGQAYYSESGWEHPHFKTRIFAQISNIVPLDFPLSVKNFEDFLPIAKQTGITPVLGNDFMKLKSLILKYNNVPYLEKCSSVSIPVRNITKGNWIQAANECGRRFLYEHQFGKYYVDYMLMCLSDDNKYLSEINCIKNKKISGRADNCILFRGKYLFAEVKLNMFYDASLIDQIKQYCNVESFKTGKEKVGDGLIYQNHVLVIDTERICIYSTNMENALHEVGILDDIKSMSDIKGIKEKIGKFLEGI